MILRKDKDFAQQDVTLPTPSMILPNATRPGQGRFVVWEGGEGAGKSSQILETMAWLETSGWTRELQGQLPNLLPAILVTREPGGTELGQQLRQLLLHSPTDIAPTCELLLYAADRAQHVAQRIEPHLQAGGLVFCDRFTASTMAYQGFGRGLDLTMIETLNQIASAGRKPDLTLWLDVEPTTGLTRAQNRSGRQDRMEQANLAFHQQVHRGFQHLMAAPDSQINRIDANQPQAQVTQDIRAVLQAALCQWYPQISAPLLVNPRPVSSKPKPYYAIV